DDRYAQGGVKHHVGGAGAVQLERNQAGRRTELFKPDLAVGRPRRRLVQLEADPDVRIERESRIFDFDAQEAELPGGRHAAVDRDVREAQLRRGAVRREEESVAVDAEGQIEQHIGADVDLAGQLDHVAERQRIEQSLAAHAEIDDAIEALGHLNTEGRYAARLGQRDVARRLVQRVQ